MPTYHSKYEAMSKKNKKFSHTGLKRPTFRVKRPNSGRRNFISRRARLLQGPSFAFAPIRMFLTVYFLAAMVSIYHCSQSIKRMEFDGKMGEQIDRCDTDHHHGLRRFDRGLCRRPKLVFQSFHSFVCPIPYYFLWKHTRTVANAHKKTQDGY